MKAFFYYILFWGVIAFFVSCKENRLKIIKQFPQAHSLHGNRIDEGFVFKAGQIDIFDSLLIVTSTPGTTKCIHIYNKNNFEHIISLGEVGRGPNEISSPGLACVDKKSGIIWFRDMGHQKMWKFSISDILVRNEYKPTYSIPLPPDNFFIQFECDHPEIFSFAAVDKNVLISYFNHRGEIVDTLSVPDKLQIYSKIDDESRKFTSNYMYADHPIKKIHAIAYRFADVFAIVDDRGKVISAVHGPDNILQDPDYSKIDQVLTTSDIRSDNEYIYCMYSGEKRMETKGGELTPNYAKKILVYNWEGNPVAVLNLEYPLVSFDVDSQNNLLYTFCPETGGIVYYQVPTF
ncbi:MAG: BF3164 family lipoprotein [Prolixibacteraceae bacterium]